MHRSILFVLLIVQLRSAGQVTWQRTYGGTSTDQANAVVATSDGRYFVVGSTGSFGAGAGDIYALMLDPNGVPEWSMTLGGAGVDQGHGGIQSSDGGFVVVGFTNGSGAGGYDGYLAKLNADGSPAWERTYGGEGWDFFYSVTERPDGGYLVVGETFSSGAGDSDVWLVRLDADGEVVWERTYGGPESDFGRCIRAVDEGFIVAGARTIAQDQDAWLLNIADDGDTLWTSTQGGDSLDYALAVTRTVSGGFAAVGSTRSWSTYNEAYHFKVDQAGALVWQFNHGQDHNQASMDIKELPDGRLLSVGYVDGTGSGGLDMFIFFTHENGTFQRGVTNAGDNGEEDEVGNALDLTDDGGAIICGYTTSFGYGPQDVYAVKVNDTGWTATVAVIPYQDDVGFVDSVPVDRPSVFPNPASVSCRLSSRRRLASAQLLDPRGRLVRSWSQPVPQDIDLRGLTDGIYQLVTLTGERRRASQPLIIAGN